MTAPAPSLRSRLRKRSDRLREEVDATVRAERQQGIRTLLRQPLLLPVGRTAADFSRVRRHGGYLAEWFAHHAAWTLGITAEAIRLRKTPADPGDATRPALDPKNLEPFNRRRYALLCVALSVLERGDRQITLGRLFEHIAATLAADPHFAANGVVLDPGQQTSRRDLVLVLRLLVELGAIRRIQGSEDGFVRDQSSDALYSIERPVLAALPLGARSPSLFPADAPEPHRALVEEPVPHSREARNRTLRVQLVRRLLDDPVVYFADLSEEALAYLESQRTFLLKTLEEDTGLVPEVRAEGIALADLQGDTTDVGLPEEGTEGHLTLLLAEWMALRLRQGQGGGAVRLTREEILRQTRLCIREHARHWRKDASLPGAEKALVPPVLDRLVGLGLVRRADDGFRLLPAIARFALIEEDPAGRAAAVEQTTLFR